MMSVSTLFIGLDAVSCVLICLVTLGIVLGLVDFHFLLSILCMLLILSRLINNNNNNIRLLKIDKPLLNTEMLKVKVIHT